MKHPELLWVPVLAVLDYYLTVLGAVWAERGYRRHFRLLHYELNPLWQQAIAEKRWFNAKHSLLVVAITVLLLALFHVAEGMVSPFALDFFAASLLGMYGAVVGRHLSNLLLFRYIERHPEQVAGEVRLAHQLGLKISQQQLTGVLCPLLVVALLGGVAAAWGALCGVATMALLHQLWQARARRAGGGAVAPGPSKEEIEAPSPVAEDPPEGSGPA